MPIYKGSEGVKLPISLRSNNKAFDLTGATVDLIIQPSSGSKLTKTAIQITDSTQGKCSYTLTSTDLAVAGEYQVQAIVKYADNRKFPCSIKGFTVEEGL